MSHTGLEDLNPFLVLDELVVALVSGLLSQTVMLLLLLVLLSLSLLLVSMSAWETAVEELWLSDLESAGVELQATAEGSLAAGLSGGSV